MDHQWTNEELTEVIEELCRRTAVDPDFRQLALTRPKAALAKVTTRPLPAGITFKFVDNSGSVRIVTSEVLNRLLRSLTWTLPF